MVWHHPSKETGFGWDANKDHIGNAVQLAPGQLATVSVGHMLQNMATESRTKFLVTERQVHDIGRNVVAPITRKGVDVYADIAATMCLDLKERFCPYKWLHPMLLVRIR